MQRSSDWLLRFSPLAMALLVMLPRLVSPQFGLFDDGSAAVVSDSIWSRGYQLGWEANQGRFRPGFWFEFALIHALAGQRPFWFFAGNALLLIGLVFGVQHLLRRKGAAETQVWISAMLLVFAGPVIENAYTLSKTELLQLAALAAALALVVGAVGSESVGRRWIGLCAAALAILIALLSKETTLAVLPLSLGWLVAGRIMDRDGGIRGWFRFDWRTAFLLATLLAVVAFFALQIGFSGQSLFQGNYSGEYRLDLQNLRASSIRWGGWLIRDFLHVIGLAALGVYLLATGKLKQRKLLLDSVVWMGVWVAVFLPWIFMQEYYMLPFAVGAAVLSAAILVQLPALLARLAGRRRTLARLATVLIAVGWVLTLLNNLTTARIQLAVDAVNRRAMESIAAQLPDGSRLLVHLPLEAQYRHEMGLQLEHLHGRSDLVIDRYRPEALQEPGYLITPVIRNQPRLTVRIGVAEAQAAQDRQELMQQLGTAAPLDRIVGSVDMLGIDFPRLLCPLLGSLSYCSADEPFLDLRQFEYGWELYRWTPAQAVGGIERT